MLLSWLRKRRRRKLLAQPFPVAWLTYLRRNVAHYDRLPPPFAEKLLRTVQVFVAEKEWVGCGRLTVTDEMRVTIAGQACLLLLGHEGQYCFDGVRTILLYPGAYRLPTERQSHHLLVDEDAANDGEAWHRGPIVLAWDQALAGGRGETEGDNLVIHEFAHHLDGLDGEIGGTPPLAGIDHDRWERVMDREFEQLGRSARRRQATLLDPYGATDRAEFFAVVSECFFELPLDLETEHPELYELLQSFYRQDPARWQRAGGLP